MSQKPNQMILLVQLKSCRLFHRCKVENPQAQTGFQLSFFKRFSLQLSPQLLSVFEESLNNGSLPFSMRQASISLILKPNKNPLDCGSYRPISLLNVDVKILAKVLSLRLETIVQDIIHPDQTGFIKNRQGFFNLRRLMNIIYTSSDFLILSQCLSMRKRLLTALSGTIFFIH